MKQNKRPNHIGNDVHGSGGSIMEEEEHLTFDDLQSDSDATAGGRSPGCSTPRELGSLRETAVEVHVQESEVEEL